MNRVKVAVIGYGFLGKWHAQKAAALNELCELVAIVEKFPEAQKAAKAAHPQVQVVGSLKEVMEQIDAAIIVTPTSLHHGIAKELLLAGKHVFCEKPLCSTTAEAEELAIISKSCHVVLQVGHSERCHEAWEKWRSEFLKLQGPMEFRINRYAPFKGRATDVDVVQDLMIHDIDLMLWLFDRKVLSVQATGFKIRTQHWDHVTANFKLEGGMNATITVGRNHAHEVRELDVVHAKGAWRADLMNFKMQRAPEGEVSPGVYVHEESYSKRDHLFLEQEAFYKSILTKTPAMVTAEEGVAAVKWVEAVLQAIK